MISIRCFRSGIAEDDHLRGLAYGSTECRVDLNLIAFPDAEVEIVNRPASEGTKLFASWFSCRRPHQEQHVSTLNLAGRRIFVVEDEALLAWDICAQIEACGGVVIGPAMSLAAAHDALQENSDLDGSVLDIRLGKEMAYPLIEPLEHAGVPVVFASSESREGIPSRYAHIPLFRKPIDFRQVAKQLFTGR